ncbi:hypothetical protein V8G54_003646 [Vigna mungo]|uniref:Uncharacterized protein n=1 Tax=Vigna mungo TaxID=3915 RepID=A0AAQ3PDT3_VIGMU
MGIILQGNHYVFAEEVGAPVNEDVDEDDQEAPMQDPTNVAGSSQPPPQYSLESISREIEMMATMQQTRMDEMMAFHNRRYDEINSHLHEIDSKLAKMLKELNGLANVDAFVVSNMCVRIDDWWNNVFVYASWDENK